MRSLINLSNSEQFPSAFNLMKASQLLSQIGSGKSKSGLQGGARNKQAARLLASTHSGGGCGSNVWRVNVNISMAKRSMLPSTPGIDCIYVYCEFRSVRLQNSVL